MKLVVRNQEINDVYAIIGISRGEEVNFPVEFINCKFNTEIDFVNAQFKKWLTFEECFFEKPILFGKANTYLYSSCLNQDLVFRSCDFKDKACFDGIVCGGSVTFDHCSFDYKSEFEQDFALSFQAATISVKITITECIFIGGSISMKALKIERVGGYFSSMRVVCNDGIVDFSDAHFGNELLLEGCDFVCENVSFDYVSVNAKGHISIEGKTISSFLSVQEAAFGVLGKHISNSQDNYSFDENDIHSDCLLFYYFDNGCCDFILHFDNKFYSIKSINVEISKRVIAELIYNEQEFLWFNCTEDNLIPKERLSDVFNESLVPLFERWPLIKNGEVVGCLCLCDGIVYVKKVTETAYSSIGDLFDYCFPMNISDSLKRQMEQKYFGDNSCYIKRIIDNGYKINQFIYSENGILQTAFSLSIPTTIMSSSKLSFHSINCGLRLVVRNACFHTVDFCFDNLFVVNDVIMDDLNVLTYYSSFMDMRCDSFLMRMCTIQYYGKNFVAPSDSMNTELSIVGLQFDGLEAKRFDLDHVHLDSLHDVKNIDVSLKDAQVKGQFCINNIYCHRRAVNNYPLIMIDLRDAKFHCFTNYDLLTQKHIFYLISGFEFDDIRMVLFVYNKNGHYLPNEYEKVCKLVDDGVFVGNTIPLLRKIENIYEENDRQECSDAIWKYRNRLRIKQKHSKFLTKVIVTWNNWFTDYGLSTWKLLLWLLLFMLCFDVIACFAYDIGFGSALANGFVEFIPISFNSPVVEAVRGNYSQNLNTFGYGIIVIIYRLLSYILLSVLIASLSGYFNKKNK